MNAIAPKMDETAMRSQTVTSSGAKGSKSPQTVMGSPAVPALTSQTVISNGRGGRRTLPYAFTEHGAIMAATVLNSPRAVQMSVFVVRAFVAMRAALSDTAALARKLAALEREVKARLDGHDAAIVDVLRRFLEILDPPPLPEPPPKPPIGFGVKEKSARYGTKKKRA